MEIEWRQKEDRGDEEDDVEEEGVWEEDFGPLEGGGRKVNA